MNMNDDRFASSGDHPCWADRDPVHPRGRKRLSDGVLRNEVPPGSNVPPPHSHANNEELVYVLEGVLRYTVGGETRDLRPGDTMATPRGVVHGFSNPHSSTVRALVMNTPDIGAQYFREVAAIINAAGPPDLGRLIETMRMFGIVPARGSESTVAARSTSRDTTPATSIPTDSSRDASGQRQSCGRRLPKSRQRVRRIRSASSCVRSAQGPTRISTSPDSNT